MYLDQRTKKFLKVFGIVALVFVLAGCTSNLDANGKLIVERAINESTKWSLDAGIFDFILTIPIAKGILFISNYLGGIVGGVVGMTIFVNLLILPIMVKSTVSSQKMQLIQPEIEKIQMKYRGRNDQASQMRMSVEIQNLYKKHNISMFASFTTFLTLPIMLAMWQSVQRLEVIYTTTFFGLNLGEKPLEMITHVMGAKSALTIIPIALINENDIVITTSPGYQVLSNMSCWLKAKIYSIPLLEENNYLPDLDSIDEQIYEQCKIFIINYPNNPTGAIATKTFYEKLISLALKYNFLIVNDCAYGPFSYKKKPLSIMSMEHSFECAVEIHTLSKAYNMTGMRIGFIVGNEQFIDIFKKVKDNLDSGQYIPIQLAACEAYDNCINYLNKLKKKYYLRMKKISSILNKYNIISKLSDGTFYLFVKVPDKFNNADTFTRYLLDKCGIFTIPYDEVGHHVRFSMTFKVNTTEQDFYNDLEKRLSKLSKLNQ